MKSLQLIKEAFTLGGIKEVSGEGSSPTIISMIKKHLPSASDDDSKTAWCGIFMGEMCDRAGISKPVGYMSARKWIGFGTKVVDPSDAHPGDIVVFKRGERWQGHVGIFVRVAGENIVVYGGNQGDQIGFSYYSKANLLYIGRV